MKKKFQGSTRAKRQLLQALRTEFETGESVFDFFARTMVITNKIRAHGGKMEDVTVVDKNPSVNDVKI